ncbi:bile acid:sodium symporter [Leptolyngbya sp. 15MV]|nr:bile acid:sodium symporter [Leptolyngbya sp. 15MV]
MIASWLGRIDLMVRLLLVAIALAFVAPAAGEARDTAQMVSNGAIFVLFLLNGLRIDRREVVRGLANLRFLVPLALWVFGGMALAGLAVATAAGPWLAPEIGLGFLFLGVLPSTVQSATSYTALAHGNVALAVIAAAILNILGVVLSAPLFALMAGSAQADLGLEVVGRIALILVLPFAIGQAMQKALRGWVADQKARIVWIDRLVIALAVYVAFSGAVEQGVWQRLDMATWTAILGAIAALLLFAHAGAWMLGQAVGLPLADRIALLFSGGQKSAAIGVPLGAILFPPETAGLVLVPLLIYHLLQLVMAAPLATRLARLRVRSQD